MSGKRWILFFLFLLGAGLASALIPIFFNSAKQMNLEDVSKFEGIWGRQNLFDYTLLVRLKKSPSGKPVAGVEPEVVRFKFRVRGGRVVEAARNGVFQSLDGMDSWDIPALFRRLRNYRQNAGKRDYLAADFHKTLGYPIHWIWVKKGGDAPSREEVDLVLE